jgi:isopenicillin-N N-acyltransferase like protein
MSELIIGARRARPRSQSAVRALAILALLAAIAGLVSYLIFRRVTSYAVPDGQLSPAQLAASRDGTLDYGGASLSHRGQIRVLRLRGAPHDVGASRSRLLGEETRRVSATFDPPVLRAVETDSWLRRLLHGSRIRWRFRQLDEAIPGHRLVEIAGLMRGSERFGGLGSYADILRRHAALDIGVASGGAPDSVGRSIARSLTIVTALQSVSGERLLIGRHLGLAGATDGGDAVAHALTVAFVHPDDAIPYASIEWPGMIGAVSAVNREGIAIMVHPTVTADVKVGRKGQPVALIARDVLENARSLKDAIAILEHARPLGAASYVIVDGSARRWAVVEKSPEKSVTLSSPPPVIGDLLTADAFKDDPINDQARRTQPGAQRVLRAQELLRAAPPTAIEQAAAVLRDRRGLGGATIALGHRTAIDDLGAAHVALFDPSALVIWVCEGPSASARFRAFDLRHELRNEGARPAPPPDIPAEAGFDEGRASAVRSARAQLRLARQLWTQGQPRRAQEHVERALSYAPDLPRAHRLAGELARADGDTARSRHHFLRYLELGPEDLGAAEAVRALVAQP